MKKLLIALTLMGSVLTSVQAQKYFTREGKISFFSEAPLEKIEAHNSSATSVLDAETGKMEFAVLIKAFQFEKALMQEHFNENYMESNTFPKAVFKGAIVDYDASVLKSDGEHKVTVKGDLTIHGETNNVETEAVFNVKSGKIQAGAEFEVAVADYGVKIPKVVVDNIAKIVQITVDIDYQLFNK